MSAGPPGSHPEVPAPHATRLVACTTSRPRHTAQSCEVLGVASPGSSAEGVPWQTTPFDWFFNDGGPCGPPLSFLPWESGLIQISRPGSFLQSISQIKRAYNHGRRTEVCHHLGAKCAFRRKDRTRHDISLVSAISREYIITP